MNEIKLQMIVSTAMLLCTCCMTATTSADDSVQLEFRAGRVWLTAHEVSRSTILAEWARSGGVTIVNGDRVGGSAITLELKGVPEREALDSLLRGTTGYIVAERRSDSPGGAARFDRISILTDVAAMPMARNAPPPTAGIVPNRDPATRLLEDALRLTGFAEDPESANPAGAQPSSDTDPLAQLLRSAAVPRTPRMNTPD